MPSRWLKEAYCTSDRINAASPEARDLWVRLLLNADDYGYFHGSAQIVASKCYPLQPNARKCEQLLTELESVQLIVRYESGGKRYLALTQWSEKPRSKPKYPTPPDGCLQLRATAGSCGQLPAINTSSRSFVPVPVPVSSAPSEITLDAEHGWQGITENLRQVWATAYPALVIDEEIARAFAWTQANPKNRKANWHRFLTGWLARAQERAPPLGNGSRRPQSRQVAL